MRKWIEEFFLEIRRVGWALVLLALGVTFLARSGSEVFANQLGVLVWKLVLIGTSVTVAHIIRQQLFPYLDLSAALDEKSSAGAVVFLGVAIVYSAIVLAICSGL